MSFLKKLLKASSGCPSPDDANGNEPSQGNPTNNRRSPQVRGSGETRQRSASETSRTSSRGHVRSSSYDRCLHHSSRSNSPSPAPSPKHSKASSGSSSPSSHQPQGHTLLVSLAGSSPSHTTYTIQAPSPGHPHPTHITTTTVGVRSPISRHGAQVLPGLILGSQEFAQDLHALERHKVTHILNMTEEVAESFPDKFIYKRVAIPDKPSTDILPLLEGCLDFIQEARAQKGCVLVHCYFGASRSASVVIGYLIKVERMRYREALEYLQLLRPGVQPNDGFEKQLKQFELQVL